MAASWWFQANPNFFLVDEALKELPVQHWLARNHRFRMRNGDRVYIWRCGKNAALVSTGRIVGEAELVESDPAERKFEVRSSQFAGPQWRVILELHPLKVPISRGKLLSNAKLANWKIIQGSQGTNFQVPPAYDIELQGALDDYGHQA